MRINTALLCVALGCAGVAVAQPGAGAGTSANSDTAVSANRSGTSASNNSAAAANTNGAQANAAAGDSEFSAELPKSIDARRVKPGNEVTATSAQDLRANGVLVPRGSRLIGHVTQAQPKAAAKGAQGGGDASSSLGLVFDHAVLKDGRQVTLHATIRALAAAQSFASNPARGADSDFSDVGTIAGTAGGGGGGVLGGRLGGTGALGAAAGNAEGSVITSASRNVRLDSGTRLLLSASSGAGQ